MTARAFSRPAAVILCGAAVVVLTFSGLSSIYPEFWATDDGVRDLLLARDCAEQSYCHTVGSPSSLPGFHQGAVWTQVLAAVHVLGGRTEAQRILVLALASVAAGTLFVVVYRWLRPTLAVPATALFVALLTKDHLPAQLASGGASALPTVLFAAGLLALGTTGRIRFLWIASFALAVAINEHIVSLLMLPPLVAVSMLARRRPWRSLATALTVVASVCILSSAAATRANLLAFAGHALATPLLIVGVAAAVICASLGDRFRSLGVDARAMVVGALTLLPAIAGAVFLFVAQHQFSLHYANPILAPAATVAAAALCAPFELLARWLRPLRWLPTVAALAVMGAVASNDVAMARLTSRSIPVWNLEEAEALAGAIASRGWNFDDLLFRVQSVACRDLVVGMSLFAPPPKPGQRAPVLQIVKRPHGQGAQRVLETIRADGGSIDVIEIDSWMIAEELRACREPIDGGAGRVCENATPPGSRSSSHLLSSRSYPEVHYVALQPPYRAIYEVPIRPVVGQRRRFAVDDGGDARCGWRIVAATGVDLDPPLPSNQTVVRSDTGATAWLTFARPFGTPECHSDFDMRYPPCVLETSLDDTPPDARGHS